MPKVIKSVTGNHISLRQSNQPAVQVGEKILKLCVALMSLPNNKGQIISQIPSQFKDTANGAF